ncbi:co-chaperone GroES [Clostridium sp. 'deep sea']|jgi:chaperonin GroES|uniref:co-chaperone GroES n=1 Tax=Clostridium sp. 'deep sea' TaxID=2779445 RepID=UPI0018969AD5|nr:co-chaperone GroES [Clostridium sp. 'deep sea']QOR34692.1 co-chaperone GroES [Clostridium sp. 'deep sea']
MAIKPLANRVIIEVLKQKETKIGGIIMPDSAKEKPQEGKVIAVGIGKRDNNGNLMPMEVKAGDSVLFSKYAGNEVKHNGSEYLVMKEEDIIAVIEN